MLNIHPEVFKRPAEIAARQAVIAYATDLKRGGGRTPHSHPRGQLITVTSGSMAVITDHRTFVVPPERAIWLPCNTVHATRHLAAARLFTLYVAPDAAAILPARPTVIQVTSLTRELLSKLMSLPRNYDPGGSEGRLVSVLLDQIAGSTEQPLHLPMPLSEDLRAIATSFLERSDANLPIGNIAKLHSMSSRTLARRFKKETGMSLRSFRRQAKLLRALELLSMRMPVSKVSDMIGFEGPSAFVSMFKAAFGVTPGRYFR